jgi:hypothetical protein
MSMTERIANVQQQLEEENPGFAEYLATAPENPTIPINEIVELTDVNDARSVARGYFLFAYVEYGQRNAGVVPDKIIELMMQSFEAAEIGDPTENIARCRALLIGDAIELATGPTGASSGWYEAWGASIDRLHEFERKLKLKAKTMPMGSNPKVGSCE